MTNNNNVYYWDYLALDKILTAQMPESAKRHGKAVHDEMLFIVIHQAYELWFKQMLHELDSVCDALAAPRLYDDAISLVVQRLGRVVEIQKLLVQQIGILKTMTPMDFLEYRDALTPASGFQSVQFRMLEMRLGVSSKKAIDKTEFFNRLAPRHQQMLLDLQTRPCLFSLVETWLKRMPLLNSQAFCFWQAYQQAVERLLDQQAKQLQQDADLIDSIRTKQYESDRAHFAALFDENAYQQLRDNGLRRLDYQAMQAALCIYLYRDQPLFNLPYQFLSRLVEIDQLLAQWRYVHVLLVQRMIGSKIGTGGSLGYDYLKSTLDSSKVFTDLENLSTCLIPRSALPVLPEAFVSQLGFCMGTAKE
jgi:tryptophan 2,3-dioxygenase